MKKFLPFIKAYCFTVLVYFVITTPFSVMWDYSDLCAAQAKQQGHYANNQKAYKGHVAYEIKTYDKIPYPVGQQVRWLDNQTLVYKTSVDAQGKISGSTLNIDTSQQKDIAGITYPPSELTQDQINKNLKDARKMQKWYKDISYPTKDGFLFPAYMGTVTFSLPAEPISETIDLSRLNFISGNAYIEVLKGHVVNINVSPNGCRAVFSWSDNAIKQCNLQYFSRRWYAPPLKSKITTVDFCK